MNELNQDTEPKKRRRVRSNSVSILDDLADDFSDIEKDFTSTREPLVEPKSFVEPEVARFKEEGPSQKREVLPKLGDTTKLGGPQIQKKSLRLSEIKKRTINEIRLLELLKSNSESDEGLVLSRSDLIKAEIPNTRISPTIEILVENGDIEVTRFYDETAKIWRRKFKLK